MKIFLLCCILSFFCGCASLRTSAESGDIAIVNNKKSDYSIVIPAKGDPAVRTSLRRTALLLQQTIREGTGVKLPIVNEKLCCSRPECTNIKKAIYIGRCRAAVKAGVFGHIKNKSEFIICENSGDIFIAGMDSPKDPALPTCFRRHPGTAGAADFFMKHFLKVRVFWPGSPGKDVPFTRQLNIKKEYRHIGKLPGKCTAGVKIHKVLCGIGREGEQFGAGFAAPLCNITCSGKESVDKKKLAKFCREAFRESGEAMNRFYYLLYARCRKFPANCRHRKGAAITNADRIAAIFTPNVIFRLERHLINAEKTSKNAKVKKRISLVRNEFNYSKNLAFIIHHHRSYLLAPDRNSFEKIAAAVERHNHLVNSWFTGTGGKKSYPGWPELALCGKGTRKDLLPHRLVAEIEPVKWDFPTLRRRGILPGVKRAKRR